MTRPGDLDVTSERTCPRHGMSPQENFASFVSTIRNNKTAAELKAMGWPVPKGHKTIDKADEIRYDD
jgi:hypothetical protein